MAATGSARDGSFHALCIELLSTSDDVADRRQVAADALVITAAVGRRQGRVLRPQDLHFGGADLSGADLHAGVNLRGATFDAANLSGANLTGLDLRNASLDAADLRGAVLDRAWLSGANLANADLRGARLQGTDLRGAILDGARLPRGVSMKGGTSPASSLDDPTFSVADLMRLAGPDAEARAEPAPPAPDVPHRGGSGSPRRPTVLIVDDEADLREIMRRMLQRRGFDALVAGDPAQAISLCRDHPGPIDLVVTDLTLPDMSGSDLLREVAVLRSSVRVVYVSGLPRDLAVAKGLINRDAPFLKKPFTADSLAEVMWTALAEEQWVH